MIEWLSYCLFCLLFLLPLGTDEILLKIVHLLLSNPQVFNIFVILFGRQGEGHAFLVEILRNGRIVLFYGFGVSYAVGSGGELA